MHDIQIDFRKLVMIKNELFDSELLKENKFVPLEEFKRIVKYLS